MTGCIGVLSRFDQCFPGHNLQLHRLEVCTRVESFERIPHVLEFAFELRHLSIGMAKPGDFTVGRGVERVSVELSDGVGQQGGIAKRLAVHDARLVAVLVDAQVQVLDVVDVGLVLRHGASLNNFGGTDRRAIEMGAGAAQRRNEKNDRKFLHDGAPV